MKNKYVILFAKEIKYLSYILIFAFISGLIGYGVGKRYEKFIMTDYLIAQNNWKKSQDSIQEAQHEYELKSFFEENREKEKRSHAAVIKEMEKYIYNHYLGKSFNNYCKKKGLLKSDKNLAILSFVLDGINNNYFEDFDYIQLKALADKYLKISEEFDYINKYTQVTSSYQTKEFMSFEYFKEYRTHNVPSLIQKNSPQELWKSISMLVLLIYFGIRILLLFIRIGKWVKITSKMNPN